MNPQFITVKDTAKMIRKALKAQFKGQKFSVKMDGKSIRVTWVDGPSDAEVKAVVSIFEGASFDGMTDLKSYNDCWMLPNGRLQPTHARNEIFEMEEIDKPHMDAIKVHFHADHIFTTRKYTAELVQKVADNVQEKYGFDYVPDTWEYDGYVEFVDDRGTEHACENRYYTNALAEISIS